MEQNKEEEPEMKLMTDKKDTCGVCMYVPVYVCVLVRRIVLNIYFTIYSPLYI